ncbi:MAG: hypothetical protein A2219_04900 [Elusimicrobia bacterium RIFOXYA2_FULL_50_26]|nr:MAG: hypothetical protein A2219_04900 [Elusimicrobia bacterium RIFOXYA2_FULL_50_26]
MSYKRQLLLIIALALAVRLVYVLQIKDLPFFATPVGDEAAYHRTAQVILEKDLAAGKRVFYQDPFYPYYLAAVYSFFGQNTVVPKAIQLFAGVLCALLIFYAARAVFAPPEAAIAGIIAAVYPLFFFFEAQLLKSSLVVLLTVTAFYMLLSYHGKRRGRLLFFSGACLSAAIVAQGHSYFYVPFILWWLFKLDAGLALKQKLSRLALFCAGASVFIVPVAVRNYAVSGDFVLTTYQAGTNFYIGNNASATGIYSPLREGRELPPFEEIDAVALAEAGAGRRLSPSEISSYWFKKGFDFIAGSPARYGRLLARKAVLYVNNLEAPDVIDYYFIKDRSFLFNIPLLSFGIICPLAILGIFFTLRDKSQKVTLLRYFVIASFLSVILFYVFSRYRLQGVPFIIIFAAAALSRVGRFYREKRGKTLVAVAIALAALVWLSHYDTAVTTPGLGYDVTATMYMDKGDFEKAAEYFRQAIGKKPNNLSVQLKLHSNLARCYFELAQYGRAAAEYDAALEILRRNGPPSDKQAEAAMQMGLGFIFQRTREYDKAVAIFEEVRDKDPGRLDVRVTLANIYKKQGKLKSAVEEFDYVLSIDTANIVACNNLANIYRDTGKFAEARRYYQRCLEIAPGNPVVTKNVERLKDYEKRKE